MTSLISWIGVDSHATSSLYIASDSRISWAPGHKWDTGRKVFACRLHPDVFGYCGDVLFPALVLSQAVVHADDGLLFTDQVNSSDRHANLVAFVQSCFESLPGEERRAFSILHGTREGLGVPSRFRLWQLSWSAPRGWSDVEVTLPTESGVAIALGSGAPTVREEVARWAVSEAGRTSRSVFSAFCDALRSRKDPSTGGAPQLVGLYRIQSARTFGIIFENALFHVGAPVTPDLGGMSVEWRNVLFERCDPTTLAPIEGAQRQPRPASLAADASRAAV